MILEIIGIIIFLAFMSVGIFFAVKKVKKQTKINNEKYEKEFRDGKVLMPIDRRDFSDLEEFTKKTKDLHEIQEKIKTLDKDFDELEFIDHTEKDESKDENDGEGEAEEEQEESNHQEVVTENKESKVDSVEDLERQLEYLQSKQQPNKETNNNQNG